MLTTKQNLLETIHGGHTDRFVNQYEAFKMVFDPIMGQSPMAAYGEAPVVNAWGVTNVWPEGTPGPFPVHTPDKIVIKDITHWKDYVHAPRTKFSEEDWAPFVKAAEEIDKNEYFVTSFVAPGVFEQCHHLGEIQRTLMNFYEEPECMHELIQYITEYELALAEELCSHIHPEVLFHPDDWGSQPPPFIPPAMFEEFLLPAYKQIYGYYKDHGVQLIVHHSDSYAATLVPYMIQMGVDVWQGAVYENNIPEVLKNYGGKISIQGGLDNGKYDKADWSREAIHKGLGDLFETAGTRYLIPSLTMGGPGSTFDGVYDTVDKEIDEYSKKYFK